MSPPPNNPELYHIVHIDRLASIIQEGYLYSDALIRQKVLQGTSIGVQTIKDRRMDNQLSSHPGLYVGQCVPFYFCPRSVMLYMIYKANSSALSYHGGQDEIIHLRFDMNQCISWANQHNLRWAFTDSNAGSGYFSDYSSLQDLSKVNWQAVATSNWGGNAKEGKQAEFLIEDRVDFSNVIEIGVKSSKVYNRVRKVISNSSHKPSVNIKSSWYY